MLWIIAAIFSAFFAGLTSILAKCGIKKTDSDLATALRTIVVLLFSWVMVFVVGSGNTITDISVTSLIFLILSGMATGASWICYFKALSQGDINKVVPIDKSSTVLTVLLAIICFGETSNLWIKLLATVILAIGIFLIDMARWKIDDGEWKPKEEMLKIEVAAKKELGMSVAASQGAQPWVFKADEPVNTVTLEMSVDSEIELDNVQLALEDANISTVWWNGKQIDIKPQGYYVDFSITKINIGKLLKGANILTVKLPFNVVSNIENYFLLGDFGVEVTGSKVKIIEKPKVINFGDWVNQGIPFYGGALTYRTKIEGGAKTKVSLDIISAPCITVSLDGKVVSNISLAPHTADLGQLEKGEHTLDFNVYASRVNTFGAFHWTDRVAAWYGPTAWRTKGKEWSYEYRLRESGIITSPRIIKE